MANRNPTMTFFGVFLVLNLFCKLHGSYNFIYGGQASDAYLELSGCIAEKIDFEEHEVDQAKFFQRVKNSLNCGAMVTCTVRFCINRLVNHAHDIKSLVASQFEILALPFSAGDLLSEDKEFVGLLCPCNKEMLRNYTPISLVPGTFAEAKLTLSEKFDKQLGLVAGHAYTLKGAEKINGSDGQSVSLLRIRDPWGNTEWTGPYSDQSRELGNIPPGAEEQVNNDDGEFSISVEDFLTYFSQTTIFSSTPDFDMDGLRGSYNFIYGGQASDASLAPIGCIAEKIDFEEHEVDQAIFFQRVRNSLNCGAMVRCTVRDKFDRQWGLVGGHVYSLTEAEKVNGSDGQSVSLLRIRNPWGNREWTGPYSDQSQEWENIPPGAVKHANIDDGEFWISVEDFLTYFSQTTISTVTPDFDMDGCADSMNYVLRIYGQWLGRTAAGFKDRLNNPRFVFSVSDEGTTSDGYIPLFIQLIQKTEDQKTDKLSVRCDLFKVLGAKAGDRPTYVLEMLGDETNVYSQSVQSSFRHKVEPGQYVVIPSVINAGEEKEFLIRVFAPAPLGNCREIPRDAVLMSCDSESSLEIFGRTVKLATQKTLLGAWRRGVNAGGQISNRETHHLNPQYTFTVPDKEMNATVLFHLMTSHEEENSPIGLRVYPLSQQAPVNIDYLYANYNYCPEPYEGSTFVATNDLDVKYVLPAGSYILLVHMDEPDTEKEFALHVRSSCDLDLRGYQTGN